MGAFCEKILQCLYIFQNIWLFRQLLCLFSERNEDEKAKVGNATMLVIALENRDTMADVRLLVWTKICFISVY